MSGKVHSNVCFCQMHISNLYCLRKVLSIPDITASEVNEGQGIRYLISFTPFIKLGKKKRRKSEPTIAKALYMHEKTKLPDFLDKIFTKLGQHTLAIDAFDPELLKVNESLVTISYTIARAVTTPVLISNGTDYRDMVKQAMKKGNPEVKLFIVEAKVSPIPEIDELCLYVSSLRLQIVKQAQVMRIHCLRQRSQKRERRMRRYAPAHSLSQPF